MKTDITLDKEEAKKAIQNYLQENMEVEVALDDISFDITRTSAQPGSRGSPKVSSVTCEDVTRQ